MIKRSLIALVALLPALAAAQVPAHPSPTKPGDRAYVGDLYTTGSLSLFVDPAGNDANDCRASGAARACGSIQGAVNKVPKRVRHPITIFVATGSYGSGAYIEDVTCEPGVNSQAFLQIKGTLTNATVTTGTAAGTVTSAAAESGTTYALLNDTGQAWTSADLRGKLVEITGGTGAGQMYMVYTNTATQISIAGGWATLPDATSTYLLHDWGSTIGGALNLPASGPVGEVSNNGAFSSSFGAAFIVDNVRQGATSPTGGVVEDSTAGEQACVYVDRLKFTSGRGVLLRNAMAAVRFSNFADHASQGILAYDGGVVKAQSNYAGVQNAGVAFAGYTYRTAPGHLMLNGNVVDGGILLGGIDIGTTVGTAGMFSLNNNSIKNGNANSTARALVNIAPMTGDVDMNFEHYETSTLTAACVMFGVQNASAGSSGSALIRRSLISGCTGDGVRVFGPIVVGASNGAGVTGTGSSGYGWVFKYGAKFRYGTGTTLTGTAGDINLDGLAQTYTSIPANGGILGAQGSLVGTDPGGDWFTAIRLGNVTNASLPTCNADYKGGAGFDTTTNVTRVCDATTWNQVGTVSGVGTAVIDFASTGVGACVVSSAVTVTGAAFGDTCTVGASADPNVTGEFSCRVTASGQAKVVFCSGAATQDPASLTYTVRTIR